MPAVFRLLIWLAGFAAGTALSAADAPVQSRTETAKIEALLAHLSAQQGAKFIRNGSEYDHATAVKFLRSKWERQGEDVKTARDFIARIATKSSTSGKVYRIRLEDGKEVDCADFLNARLAELEAKSTGPIH